MLEPNLDLTSFNFYYEADQSNNPERKPVWVDAMYIDPVGRGWMITLTRPVYHNDELKLVLGMDITLNDIIENYVNKTNHQILIVDREGTVVAGKSKTIEVFSLPPLKNHTYTQTITSDSFRKEDFNLFKSRSKEVRRIAGEIINGQKNEVWMTLGQRQIKIVSKKMSKLDWFVLEVFF
jgi:C4-dicarboxylate-specific signal transduction histidine kinase